MRAVWLRLRADARSRWRAWAALSIAVGLAGGVVIASLVGAKRTDSAYDRFLRWSNSADLVLFNAADPIDFEKVRELPEVAEALDARFAWMVGDEGVSDLDPVYAFGRGLTKVDRPKLLAGRRPNPRKVNEASITPVAVRLSGLTIGDRVSLRGLAPDQLEAAFEGGDLEPEGPRVTFRIVGIEATAGEFVHDAAIHLTPAFGRAYEDRVATIPVLAVNLKRGAADLASFKAGAERLSGGAPVNFDAISESAKEVNRTLHVQAVALRLFAMLAGLASIVILAQAMGRETAGQALDQPALKALGMTRPQVWMAAVLRTGVVALAGAAVAGALAVTLSPYLAFGLAKEVDPASRSFDAPLALGGLATLALLTLGAGALSAWRVTRSDDYPTQTTAGARAVPSRVAAAVARAGVPPSAVVGVRMALEPGRGRSAVPTRSALVGTVLSLAAVVTVLTFAASLHHLFTTPRLYGWNWDAVIGSPFDEDVRAKVVPALSNHESVSEFSSVSYAEVQIDDTRVRALAFESVRGAVLPPLVEGREPRRPDEIVIGARTLRDIGRSVGDRVNVGVGDEVVAMRVVGRGVLPSMGESDEGGLGEGAFITLAGLHRLVPEAPVNLFPVRYSAAGAAAPNDEGLAGLEGFGLTSAEPPKGVADFGRVDNVPMYLSGLLVLLAAGTLAHTLVTGVRRRRRDLAILKTIGFVRGQVGAAVAWQATALVGIALVFGLPLGLAGGRLAWKVFADQLGIVPEPVMPVLGVLVLVPATLVVANLLAALPGRSAAATRPALVLRSE